MTFGETLLVVLVGIVAYELVSRPRAGSTAATTTASGHLAADLVTPISPLLYPGQGSTYVNPMDPYEVR